MEKIERFLPIDEEGYFVFDGRRVSEPEIGGQLLAGLQPYANERIVTAMNGVPAWVEAFDAPLVAKHVRPGPSEHATLDLPYSATADFALATLSVDEWDRFHGLTDKQIPFVFSRQAQYEFFELLDGFDDDSITVQGRRYPVPTWLAPKREADSSGFWSTIYKTEQPGWELGRESAVLPNVLPQLKLNRSRVLVLGCGSGHDAAYLARQGHVVTGVDFSDEALQRARAAYGSIEGLKFERADVFALPTAWTGRFDMIFEHTCYCAISPDRRDDLVDLWLRMLAPGGHLFGVFFATEKREGPAFGGSEWEVRERLKGSFEFLFWTRWRHSIERRQGKELVVYARKTALP